MAILLDIRKRLLYAKYLLFRAKRAQTERNELSVAVSLLLMHDASELLMLAVTDHLGLGSNESFMEFWEKVKQSGHKEPAHKVPMEQLNSLRVGLKHKGTLPHAQTVRDLLPRVEAFCEEVTKELLDVSFSDLSLAILVADDDVRNTLQEAEKALTNGYKKSAYLNVRLAFDKLHRLMSKDISLIKKPQGIKVPKSALPNETKQGLLNLQGVVFDLVGTMNTLVLGIDPVSYRFLISNTPAVSWTLSGDCLDCHTSGPNSRHIRFRTGGCRSSRLLRANMNSRRQATTGASTCRCLRRKQRKEKKYGCRNCSLRKAAEKICRPVIAMFPRLQGRECRRVVPWFPHRGPSVVVAFLAERREFRLIFSVTVSSNEAQHILI